MKKKLKMIKKIIKDLLLKEELDSMSRGAITLTSKLINLEARIIAVESEGEELKAALGNLSVAYLEIIKSLPFTNYDKTYLSSQEDDYLDELLRSFNSQQNDDDLIN